MDAGNKMVMLEHEYPQTNYFANTGILNPTESLKGFRKGVFTWGGFMLFIFFAGLEIKGFSGGVIKASITNTFVIPIYIGLYFSYNFIQYLLQLNNEFSVLSAKSDLQSYCATINRFLMIKELKEIDRSFNPDLFTFGGPGNFPGTEGGTEVFQCELEPLSIYKERYAEAIKESRDLYEHAPGRVRRKHSLTAADKDYFYRHYDKLKYVNLHEFMQYKLPYWFGYLVWGLINYSMTAYFSNAPSLALAIKTLTAQ